MNCLLTIFVHNYYAQLIYYTDFSKCCESLTDWTIPLSIDTFSAGEDTIGKTLSKLYPKYFLREKTKDNVGERNDRGSAIRMISGNSNKSYITKRL